MEKIKSLISRAKRILDLSIMVVPNSGTKIRRFSSVKILTIAAIYSLMLLAVGYLSSLFFMDIESMKMSEAEILKIKTLNEQYIELAREIENLEDSNQKLKNAILLADSTAFDQEKDKSVKKVGSKVKGEGNIYSIFLKIIRNIKENQSESYYFTKPAEGFISRRFNSEKGHYGIDIVLKTGNAIYSSGNGYITFADYTPEDGYMIIINHDNDFVTIYKHCSTLLKKPKDYAMQGEIIALSGNSGESTGPHLHFEIWKKGVPQNPDNYLIINK
jgi:murein DD-endopeptidase MepM/ murein hydrolase activator NlpD